MEMEKHRTLLFASDVNAAPRRQTAMGRYSRPSPGAAEQDESKRNAGPQSREVNRYFSLIAVRCFDGR